jgi:hypothetical protein
LVLLLSVPVEETALAGNLLLEHQNTIEKCLGGRRAAWDVDIDRDNAVTATNNGLFSRKPVSSNNAQP